MEEEQEMGKKLIDANEFEEKLVTELNVSGKYTPYECGIDDAICWLKDAPTVDAVEVEKYNELKHDNDVLKRLINGEWVDTEDVQKALGIDFSTGMRMFELSRTAKWNPAPLNGQYIETKFRLKGRSDGEESKV